MTNPLPHELLVARSVLTRIETDPFAQERIYRNIVKRPSHEKVTPWRWGVLVVSLVTAASAAYGLGFVAPSKTLPPPVDERFSRQIEPKRAPVGLKQGHATPPTNSITPSETNESSTVVSRPMPRPSVIRPLPSFKTQKSASELSDPVEDTELRQQVRDYREAVVKLPYDPAQALALLRHHRQRWPRSTIIQEVDLRIVQALVALGHTSDAGRAATQFIARYPNNTHVTELRQLAGSDDTNSTDEE